MDVYRTTPSQPIASLETSAPAAVEPKNAAKDNGEPSAFSKVLGRLGNQIDKGEHLVKNASHGTMSSAEPGQLIALQAGIYQYVEAVDLASKLVDRATNGVKTVLQSQ